MISMKKIGLCILCYSVLSPVACAERASVNDRGGGAGGGSNGRNDEASNSDSATSPVFIGGATNIASSSSSSILNTGDNSGSITILGNLTMANTTNTTNITNISTTTTNTAANSGSTTTTTTTNNNNNNNNNNVATTGSNSGTISNFGDFGTLGLREVDVLCHICDAVPDKSYDAGVKVTVAEGKKWTCGYLQETVQDVDPYSPYEDVRRGCRHAQRFAEEGGCCSQTMYINLPGKDLHEPCALCAGGTVAPDKINQLVDTKIMGTHSCGGLYSVMKENIFSANLCPEIIKNAGPFCCNSGATARSASLVQKSGRQTGLLRGAAAANGLIP